MFPVKPTFSLALLIKLSRIYHVSLCSIDACRLPVDATMPENWISEGIQNKADAGQYVIQWVSVVNEKANKRTEKLYMSRLSSQNNAIIFILKLTLIIWFHHTYPVTSLTLIILSFWFIFPIHAPAFHFTLLGYLPPLTIIFHKNHH